MMRRSLAACLGACLLFGTLALAPDDAAAWLINQPRFEKQVVTEGDPDDPGLAYPSPPVSPSSAEECAAGSLSSLGINTVVVVVAEILGL
ncbi:MAG: hypothetical protein ACKVU1_11980 [bacterium]